MPKPRSGDIKRWSCRITPVDQKALTPSSFDILVEDYPQLKLLVYEEHGTKLAKLHYHCYLESTISKTHLSTLLSRIGGATSVINGNAVFSVKAAHDGTAGYAAKEFKQTVQYGYTEDEITELEKESLKYRKALEAERKQKQRLKASKLELAVVHVKECIAECNKHGRTVVTTGWIYDKIKSQYGETPLPSRNTLETTIVNLMDDDFKRDYYLKNFSYK